MAVATPSFDTIFCAAIEMPSPEDRAAYIADACGDDADLRGRVEKLVGAHFQAGTFLEPPAESPDATVTYDPASGRPGTMIGPYKLLQQIGEGGMGTVFMAEQTEPVKRKVALKIIKAGMDSRQVIARFEAERQALAMMDHVNIARVFDGGTTGVRSQESGVRSQKSSGLTPDSCLLTPGEGRPYFVMELVHGLPITKYCDDNHLTPRERLELFVPVCKAIQHAHQKGIIHRDIKPSNVMITLYDGKPIPKVIDFGVAKATEQKLTKRTLFTQYGTMVGTLEYMSPEQAEMSALGVDTRSDIYSLGVLLYELLTGSTPLSHKRLKDAGFAEILRIIKEEEPPKPSTRLSDSGEALASISAQRHMEPAKLTRLVRGELDWIVMKCLEKDRNRRYETANGFAMDVQRYLADEPVLACPPSTAYRLSKFVRRNRMSVFAAAITGFVLFAGTVGTTIGLMEARRQRDAANLARQDESREKDRAIAAEHLASNRLSQVETEKQRADEERAIAQAMNDFVLKDLLGQAYSGNQPFGAEFTNLNPRITVREVLDRARKVIDGKFAGQPLVESAVRLTLADTYLRLGEYALAIPHAERGLALREARLSADHPDALAAKVQLAHAYSMASRPRDAIPLMEQVHDKQVQDLGPEDLVTIGTLHDLASAYLRTGRRDDAIELLETVHAVRVKRLALDDPEFLNTASLLALAYLSSGKATEAITLMERARDAGLNRYSADHPGYLTILDILGRAYLKGGRTKEAIDLFKTVRDGRAKVLEADHPMTLAAINHLADGYKADGRLGDAIPLYEHAAEIQKRKLPVGHIDTLVTLDELAKAYKAADRLLDVIRTYVQIVEIREKKYGLEHGHTLASYMHLGNAYKDAGKLEQALVEYQRSVAGIEKAKFEPPRQLEYIGILSDTYEQLKQPDRAESWRRKSVEIAKTNSGAHSIEHAIAAANLGMNLVLQSRWDDAEAALRPVLVSLQGMQRDEWITFGIRSILGEALMGREKYTEAEPLLLDGFEGLKRWEAKIPPNDSQWLTQAIERLARLYESLGKPDKASEWRKKLASEKLKDKK